MAKYIMRLDDACEKMDVEKWARMESLLDRHGIKPLVGIIPKCEDKQMEKYAIDLGFWDKAKRWEDKGWTIALHGYNHVYSTECGGINPVNKRSEFAGETLEVQREKIRLGIEIFKSHGFDPQVFFAPSHTFDDNTLLALIEESRIRIISDTVANDVYFENGFTFVPQQTGRCRKLPVKIVTCCYHPNEMRNIDFEELERFIKDNSNDFVDFPIGVSKRKKSLFDRVLKFLYFARKR